MQFILPESTDHFCPASKSRTYKPLYAPHSIEIRSKEQQLPKNQESQKVLSLVYDKFKDNPFDFEKCAVEIARLMMPDIGSCEVTR
ncbi:hypothetical protein ACJJIE_17900 [Microbulbifer sp. TRSA001]|uniref:hypothetical protein n=1 Tax=unclassified Microbulbifer TaxID=2619833 RepID=UPI0024ACAF0F|nr:hypothetical protein [Microbulbifer sp. VAAF005]WHI44646.1 hypothetical protein P0078_12905 [Microbulbifer sp. VAAF005]